MNGKHLEICAMIRYLGAKLYVHDGSNIVSTTATNKSFTYKMNVKLSKMRSIRFNHDAIVFKDKISLGGGKLTLFPEGIWLVLE